MRRLASIALLSALSGCGTQPLPTPDPLDVKPPQGSMTSSNRQLGLTWQVPRNWRRAVRKPPGLFRLVSGGAEVPADAAALRAAKDALVAEIMRRDPAFRVASTRTRTVAGLPAIEVDGTQTLLGREIRTRSVHVYKPPVEYVLEALAPPADFAKAADGVLEPLLGSLRFGKPAGA
jgi:hypothetical protein